MRSGTRGSKHVFVAPTFGCASHHTHQLPVVIVDSHFVWKTLFWIPTTAISIFHVHFGQLFSILFSYGDEFSIGFKLGGLSCRYFLAYTTFSSWTITLSSCLNCYPMPKRSTSRTNFSFLSHYVKNKTFSVLVCSLKYIDCQRNINI